MEHILKKDIIKEVNPYLFQKIQSKIQDGEGDRFSTKSIFVLRYALIVLGALILFNIYTIFNFNTRPYNQDIAYEKFIQENYFDVLANSFNDKIIFPE